MTLTYTSRYHSFKPFKQFSAGFGCRGKCETSNLIHIPKRQKGFTCQEVGARYCRRCATHFKKEAGLRCPCCKQPLSGRIRSKQSKQYREQVIAAKENQEETYLKNVELQNRT